MSDVMPQNGMNYEGRRGVGGSTYKATGQPLGPGLVSEGAVHNGCPAPTRTNESTRAGTLNGTEPQRRVNGYLSRRNKGKSRKAMPPRTLWTQGSTFSAVADASASGRVSSASNPGGISVNGTTSLDAIALPCNSNQMTSEPSLSAARKHRRREKYGHKKRPSPMPPRKEENWENETQEVTLTQTDWENMCFGVRPYGPEDVLHFAFRDLTLKQTGSFDQRVSANYSPAVHHPRPVRSPCYYVPTEPDQFVDADEACRKMGIWLERHLCAHGGVTWHPAAER